MYMLSGSLIKPDKQQYNYKRRVELCASCSFFVYPLASLYDYGGLVRGHITKQGIKQQAYLAGEIFLLFGVRNNEQIIVREYIAHLGLNSILEVPRAQIAFTSV